MTQLHATLLTACLGQKMSAKPTQEELNEILVKKQNDLKEDLGDENANFVSSFALDLPDSPVIQNIDDDQERESAFVEATLKGIEIAKQKLIENEIDYIRPPDFFGEMLRTDEQMQRVRDNLKQQQDRIEKARARNLNLKQAKTTVQDHKSKKVGVLMKPKHQKKNKQNTK